MRQTRESTFARIAREVRYRDALHELRSDVDRMEQLLTLSARRAAANRMRAVIDAALGDEFGGPPG